ncbi:MAG: presenilin family intramembrane aspartyl protease [Candidatus ainarchaeum sp.]|nr:presenilin family intramembrane aspartyl protease [Candidatus ainarchaeum sp.]
MKKKLIKKKEIIKKQKEINKNKTKLKNSDTKSWLNKKVFLMLTILFIISQTLGLIVARNLINLGIKSSPITGDINNPLEAIYLISIILIMTTIIIILIKYKKQRKLLWLFEGLAIFATTTIVFSSFFPTDDLVVLIIALIIIVYRYTHKESVLFRNFVSIIAIAGAGALIGISLGVIVVLIFISLLSIYDLIAVFKTKHMVELGKNVTKQNLAFTVSMPTKQHSFELGNGDLIIPLILAASIIANGFFNNNFLVSIFCLIGSLIGLIISIYIVSVKKIPLPALPPQTIIMIIIIFISALIGL